MFYNKSNGSFAVAVANKEDIVKLAKQGLDELANKAKQGDVKAQACLQRLVNGNHIPEGNY